MSKRRWMLALSLGLPLAYSGCSLPHWTKDHCAPACPTSPDIPTAGPAAMRFDEPCLETRCLEPWHEMASPVQLDESSISEANTMVLSLEECVQLALQNSPVLRDLGGTVLRNPDAQATRLEPSLVYTDPRFGQEAALSEFDAVLSASADLQEVDRAFNSVLLGNGGRLVQDLDTYQWELVKPSATGGRYAVRHVTLYDRNNQPSNRFPSTYDTFLEGEIRHPLMQGAGTHFNRIAGYNATPGNINGVLIARVRQDISLADFERNVRDLVADVENAYWDLYYAYRDLNAKIDVRDKAKELYEGELNRQSAEAQGGDVEQAKEQYFRFQAEVVDALNGRPIDATRTYNGSSGGTFRGQGGLRVAERRLRLIVGMPINDGQIIRPSDQPPEAPIVYDWQSAVADAMMHRAELRRQRWVIKQRELELVAHRNFLKPRLDVVGQYRLRGFGDELFGGDGVPGVPDSGGAFDSLSEGDYQEWAAGVEFLMPIGFRRAHAAIRNTQLQLERERAVLREQERHIYYGLSNAFSEVRRAYNNRKLQEERLEATASQINKLVERREKVTGGAPLDVILEAYRRYLDIRLQYHQAEVEYVLALRNIQYEKGTLLEYCNVALTEGAWPNEAYRDAQQRAALRGAAHAPKERDPVVSAGDQG